MKHALAFVLMLTLVAFVSKGQENVSIGPIIGLSMANLKGDIDNTNWKPGLTVGGFYNYSSDDGFGFSGQLLFTQLGARINQKTNEVNFNYLQIPLFATFFFGKYGQRVRPKVFLGPTLNFLLSARDINKNNINGDPNNTNYKPFDLGLTLGGGVNIRLQNRIWLNLDARYGVGLLDVTRAPNIAIFNNSLGFNAGLSFPLGTYNKKTGRFRAR